MAKRNAVVVTHTRARQTGTVVAEAVSQLRVAGFEVAIIDNTEAPDFGVQPPCVSDDTEIVVVLGGDGTILRAAELVHCTQVPILGVNMGHVGFLAEFESFQIDEAIRRVSTHDYSIDERMIAHVDVWLPGATKPIEDWALNDITLERADRGKMVELSIRVDDVEMNSFGADGVIVSTPTGSTAYAFSAGGPVMWPNVKALQLIPLAAHARFAMPRSSAPARPSPSIFWTIPCPKAGFAAWTPSARPAAGYARHGARIARYLAPRRFSGVPFTNRLVSKFDLPVVGWREHARNEASSQSLHHGHTFPAAAYAAGVAVAGDAGVAGTEPDKPGERDGKAGS